ncbi:efflux transporter outer membrane subunit [Shewanella algae]|uniref:efflux transporter outer membrane subunit n=1 Tax=Shewanella algae TaxID=38313 RepID=UPI00214BD0E2|nr:efflux transporter outer membrane subunit [Shewanella algae]
MMTGVLAMSQEKPNKSLVSCKRTRPALVALILSSGLWGCTLGPDYQRPELNMPAQFDKTLPQVESNEAVKDEWQTFFLNPELQALIRQALGNNIDLAMMQSRLRAARAEGRVVDAALWPELGLEFEAKRSLSSAITNKDPSAKTALGLNGVASWELDIWGANRRASEAALANTLSQAELLEASKISLISDIATAFYELTDIEQRLKISRETAQIRAKELQLAKLRRANGMISGLDVHQAEVEYQTAMVTLPQLEYDSKAKRNQLLILLGAYDHPLPELPKLVSSEFPESLAVGVPSQLLSRRPDVRASELALVAATAGVGVAKSAFFPGFTITAEYGRESNSLDNLFSSKGLTWSLLGGITAPIFNAGKISAEYEIANEAQVQAMLAYRSTVLNAYMEVRNAMNDYQRTQQALIEQQRLLDASSEYVRLARLRYKNGVATSLDLMDAQRQRFSAELSLSESKRDKLLAMIALYRALRGGAPAKS